MRRKAPQEPTRWIGRHAYWWGKIMTRFWRMRWSIIPFSLFPLTPWSLSHTSCDTTCNSCMHIVLTCSSHSTGVRYWIPVWIWVWACIRVVPSSHVWVGFLLQQCYMSSVLVQIIWHIHIKSNSHGSASTFHGSHTVQYSSKGDHWRFSVLKVLCLVVVELVSKYDLLVGSYR